MITYKTYPKYKPSGIAWLGDIPEHWEVKKLSAFFDERREKCSDTQFKPLSVTKYGIVPQLDNAAKTIHGDNRKKVCKGDFVINSRSDRKGSSGLAKEDGSVSVINIALKPRNIHPNFSEYLLKSYFFKEEYYRFGRGIVADLWTTRYSEMKNMELPKASLPEQEKIAHFLDYKTAKIDRFIRKKKQLIKLLNEQKAGIINDAVTGKINCLNQDLKKSRKSLNPLNTDADRKTKPSGIEWLGDIPEHWEVRKLKYSVRLNQHQSFDNEANVVNKIALENIESKSGRLLELSENTFEGVGTIFKNGDVLFGKLRPYLGKVISTNFEGSCVNEILVLTPDKKMWISEYLKFRMLSLEFIKIVDDSTFGAKMPRASWNFIGSLKISCPPIHEQKLIVSHIEAETAIINTTIATIEKEIALVQEYRTALIAEAVTGKIDVREYCLNQDISGLENDQDFVEDADNMEEESIINNNEYDL